MENRHGESGKLLPVSLFPSVEAGMEEQPLWLDDLLKDTENMFGRGHHRRSASDSYACFASGLDDDSEFVNAYFGTSSQESQDLAKLRDYSSTSTQNVGGYRAGSSHVKTELKRAKQNNAQRSRARKLQYISHLERTIQILKAEGGGVSAELEFIEQQNMILTMENRALRQRLESISQEQMIKQWEQGMLEREISRLQALYHMQKQQQQPHNQQQPKHRKNTSRDIDDQLNTNKDLLLNGPMRN